MRWCPPINTFKAVTDSWCYACVSVLFGGYDCSPSTWALHADIHCHTFLEITVNQRDKDIGIAAYYLDVRVITCFWRNSNQVMYDDEIDFFVVCFQIFSLETEIVPYLYRCWVSPVIISLVYCPWCGQSDNDINLISCILLCTTLRATFWVGSVVWRLRWCFRLASLPGRLDLVICFVLFPTCLQISIDVWPFQMNLMKSMRLITHATMVPLVSQCTVNNMAPPSMMTAFVTLWIRLDCSTWSLIFTTAFDWACIAPLS